MDCRYAQGQSARPKWELTERSLLVLHLSNPVLLQNLIEILHDYLIFFHSPHPLSHNLYFGSITPLAVFVRGNVPD